MMKKFCWIEKDYQNTSLNNLAQRVTEYFTGDLLLDGYEVHYSKEPIDDAENYPVGKIGISPKAASLGFDYTVADLHVVNELFNLNLYFPMNTEKRLDVKEHYGTFDCLVSLAAGDMIKNNPVDIGFSGEHYVIDISSTAITETMKLYKHTSGYTQVDLFNLSSVEKFLASCKGTKGLFVVSNCFHYIVSSLVYDVELRLKAQNDLMKLLANDKIEWYVSMLTADGEYISCAAAKDLQNKTLNKGYSVLPWINK